MAGIGIILSGIALSKGEQEGKGGATAGLILCIVALFFGIIRLVLGAGIV